MKVFKIILSALFTIGGIGFMVEGSVLSGILTVVLGVLLFPKVGEILKESISIWKKKAIRYITYIVLFTIAAIANDKPHSSNSFSSKDTNESIEQINQSPFESYIEQTNKNIENLSESDRKLRESTITDLKSTYTYHDLVENKVTSVEYLPVLTAINNGLRQSIIKNGEISFFIDSSLMNGIKNSKNGDDKVKFIIISISLGNPKYGGYPEDLLEMFNRYKEKYKSYRKTGVIISSNGGGQEHIEFPYNITSILYHISPSNEAFKLVYEANQEGVSNWFGEPDGEYIYKELATKQGYLEYAKQYYPDNPYIIKVDKEISATALYSAYEQNEISADEMYKNKKLGITGTISNIGKDIFDSPYISLEVDFLQNVNCYFDKDNNKFISQLRKGQQITIIGTCKGMSLTDVIIKNCELWDY
ncbi:OB-fold putative lipoprotein [Weeksellaceae bacterium TAE3-ERU29]|nr:OB-fold putative lipoprotein [Weeksellaceae bacterium TAE3-ERU29]